MKRIGVLSDTHLHGLSDALIDIYNKHLQDVDIILHAGDLVSLEVFEFLSEKKSTYAVSGNMDPIDVRKRLPEKEIIEIGNFRIGLIHGWGSSDGLEQRVMSRFDNVDAIVYGHSHRPSNTRLGNTLLFNPGAAIGYSSTPLRSIGILEIGEQISGRIIEL